MSNPAYLVVFILGSGQGEKLFAWHLGRAGRKVAVVEGRWVGGSCPARGLPAVKNEFWSAHVAPLVRNAAHFGTLVDGARTDMRAVRRGDAWSGSPECVRRVKITP